MFMFHLSQGTLPQTIMHGMRRTIKFPYHPQTKTRLYLAKYVRGSIRPFQFEVFLKSSWASSDCLGCFERLVVQVMFNDLSNL
jgi:hypothetical protein